MLGVNDGGPKAPSEAQSAEGGGLWEGGRVQCTLSGVMVWGCAPRKLFKFYMQICTFWCSLASFVQHFGRGDEKITLVPELYWGITPRPFGASSQCRVRRLCPWKILEILHANLSILLSFWHFCQFFWWGEKISYPSIFYWGGRSLPRPLRSTGLHVNCL